MTPEDIKSLKVGDPVFYYCRELRKIVQRKVTKVGRKYVHLEDNLVMDGDSVREKHHKYYHLASTRDVFSSREALESEAERRRLAWEARKLAVSVKWGCLDKDTLVKILELLEGGSEA